LSTDFRGTAGGDGIVLADSAVIGGSTLSGAELAFVDGVTAGTVTASKAVVVDADKHIDTIVIADGGLKLGATTGTAVTATAAELNILDGATVTTAEVNQYSVSIQMTDAGTAQSIWVVAPHAGSIVAAYVVNSVANATTKTVFTLEIATVLVTMPALEVAITQAAGTVSSAVPTAANVVTAGQAIEVISDGGTDATMPVTVTLVISR
jgi:hypothetical protein